MNVAYRVRTQRALMVSFCLAASLASVAACSTPELSERRRSTKKTIINGTASTAPEDEGVVLLSTSDMICTATLIAPNLILTARHCVADGQGSGQCDLPATDRNPSEFGVSLGQQPKIANAVARGTKIFAPAQSTLCGGDVALILLDKNLTAPVRKVRFTPLTKGETVAAVGYGKNENEQLTGRNMRGGLSVRGVGPSSDTANDPQSGQTFNFNIPNGDIATGESTCHGDSGGPLFDASGRLVAVTSRGITGTCLSGPALYAGVAIHADLIRSAAVAAGFPLVDGADGGVIDPDAGPPMRPPTGEVDAGTATPTGPSPGPYTPPASTPKKSNDPDVEDTTAGEAPSKKKSQPEEEADEDSDDHDHDDGPTYRDEVDAENARASAGCSMAGAYPTSAQFTDTAFISLMALVTALAFVRSRRSV